MVQEQSSRHEATPQRFSARLSVSQQKQQQHSSSPGGSSLGSCACTGFEEAGEFGRQQVTWQLQWCSHSPPSPEDVELSAPVCSV